MQLYFLMYLKNDCGLFTDASNIQGITVLKMHYNVILQAVTTCTVTKHYEV